MTLYPQSDIGTLLKTLLLYLGRDVSGGGTKRFPPRQLTVVVPDVLVQFTKGLLRQFGLTARVQSYLLENYWQFRLVPHYRLRFILILLYTHAGRSSVVIDSTPCRHLPPPKLYSA